MKLDPRTLELIFGDRLAPDGSLVRENFARWFGQSQLVDAAGAPLMLFHGTTRDFDAFDVNLTGLNDHGWYSKGIYLAADPSSASAYTKYDSLLAGGKLSDMVMGGNVMPVYVAMTNPYVWPDDRRAALSAAERDEITREVMGAGHDGVIVPNRFQEPRYAAAHEVVVFRPEQIKSAVGNSGLFDRSSPGVTDTRTWEARASRRLSSPARVLAAWKVLAPTEI